MVKAMVMNVNFNLMDGSEMEGPARSTEAELAWPSKAVQEAEERLFVENAHFLLANAHRVFLDSRLFLTPVRIMSGLAYTGALPMPCLGGYLEWWLNDKCASRNTEDGRELVYLVSGSPLSGNNVSMSVRQDGTRCRAGGGLLSLAKSYRDVMMRYREPMRKINSCTLEEALNLLKGRQGTFEHSVDRIVLEQRLCECSRENSRLKSIVASQESRIKAYEIALCRAVVRELTDDVRSAIRQSESEIDSGSCQARKGSANRPITMLFRAFAKREGVVLSTPSKRFLMDELAKI